MLLKIGSDRDVDVKLTARKSLVCVYVKCRDCGVKVWTSSQDTPLVCAACLLGFDAIEAVRS